MQWNGSQLGPRRPGAGGMLSLGLRPAFSTHQVMGHGILGSGKARICTEARRACSCRGTGGPSLTWLSRPVASSRQRWLFFSLLQPHPAQPRWLPSPFTKIPHLNSKSSRMDGKTGCGLASLTSISLSLLVYNAGLFVFPLLTGSQGQKALQTVPDTTVASSFLSLHDQPTCWLCY